MRHLLRDLRTAARMLRRSPGFAAVALATLAIGIGSSAAIFGVVDAVLLRPLPYGEPDRLVALQQTLPSRGIAQTGCSYLNYLDFARAKSFAALGAIRMHDFTLTGQGEPALVVGGTATANLFAMLRARPRIGRGLEPADGEPSAPAVAVLGDKLWRERFQADPAVLGRTVRLDEQPFTIVGVMPASFRTPPDVPPAELWTVLNRDPVFGDLRQKRGGHYLTVVGRLRDGAARAEAEAELATVAKSLARAYPKENEGWGVRLVPLAESLVGGVRTALGVLFGAVAFVFLIACANVANLLLARASGRSREVAIRSALGASRGDLVRQFLVESLLLALLGGGLGLALAASSVRALRAWLPQNLPRVSEVGVDAHVLLFGLGASAAAALIFGLAPAIAAADRRLWGALREGAAGTGESRGRRRLRGGLVVLETALSFVLLVGAGLLARSLMRIEEVPLGFNPERVLTAGMSLPRSQYSTPEQWRAFYNSLVGRLEGAPGVQTVAASLPLPLYGGGLNFGFGVEGRVEPPGADLSANYTALTPGYFRALQIPLVRGRPITERDTADAPKVCVVSQTLARQVFPGEDPIGRRLVFGFKESVPREIVGIVADVQRDGRGEPSRPEMYVPFAQEPWWAAYLVVRTAGDPSHVSGIVREAVHALDPGLPIESVQPMVEIVQESVAPPRFRATLLSLFGAAALVLAIVGIYGVLSYSVGRRTRELGIRVALGAERGDVLRLVIGEGLWLTGAGLAAGAVGAAILSRFLATLLFGVGRFDLATWAGVASALLAAGLLACWVPARRATRVDPVTALRAE